MLRLYPLVIALQVFCIYHAYTKRNDQKWFWIIIIFPFIGSLIYLYVHFYSRNNMDKVKEEVKASFVKNYKINKLEQEVKFSATFSKKIELADEHSRVGNYERALELYVSCKNGIHDNDAQLMMKLIRNYFLSEKYNEVIKYGDQLVDVKEFKNSEEKTAYAWSYFRIGNTEKANKIFNEMNTQFSNYPNRIEYIYFLRESENHDTAKQVTNELLEEVDAMDAYEKRLNKSSIKEIKRLASQKFNG